MHRRVGSSREAFLRARSFCELPPQNTNCARLEQSVRFGEANLAGVADGRAELQVGFPNIDQIPGSPSEFAGTARNVHGITGESETRLRERNRGCDGRIEVDVVADFGDPVMLNLKQDGTIGAGLRGSK